MVRSRAGLLSSDAFKNAGMMREGPADVTEEAQSAF